MQKILKKWKFGGVFLGLFLLIAGMMIQISPKEVQAATAGFRKINGKTYYIKANGTKQTGWLKLNGKTYYFYSGNGVMATGWLQNSKGQKRYFDTNTGVMATGWMKDSQGRKRYFYKGNGVMATGWVQNSQGDKRYFDPSTGLMQTQWQTIDGRKYYFYSGTGVAAKGFVKNSKGQYRYFYSGLCAMATGWLENSQGQRRYFFPETGIMATNFRTISNKTYYFYKGSGVMATGWVNNTNKGTKYYFDEETGVMAVGVVTIDGVKQEFASDGIYQGVYVEDVVNPPQPTSAKTIKNYLAGAIQPVGEALYVWGGGWTQSRLEGVSPIWKSWYNSQTSSYNYKNYMDLSASTREKGLDCSGFVGWAAYQVMHTGSNQGSGYTVVAESVGSSYRSRGWGSILTQSDLSASGYTLKPGDVGYNSGHTWIVIGQCSDKSVVIVHSTPNAGCQISGTPTPSGNYYGSQAIALAEKYMSKYPGYYKYDYHTSSGNYIKNGNYLRWYSSVLSDPDGYYNMTADQILADLFS